MGKALIWLGNKIVVLTRAAKCKWNWLITKLMFNVINCPYKVCKCKK